MGKTTKQWLLEIAIALETWRALRRESVDAELAVTTPIGAVKHLVRAIPPRIVKRFVMRFCSRLISTKRPGASDKATPLSA